MPGGFADIIAVDFIVGAFIELVGDAFFEVGEIFFGVETEPAGGCALLHLAGEDGGREAGLELRGHDDADLASGHKFPWVEKLDVIPVNGRYADLRDGGAEGDGIKEPGGIGLGKYLGDA